MKIVVASDHCGFEMKQKLLPWLKENHEVEDVGCYSEESVDFPDIAQKVCRKIMEEKVERGIMFCSTGVGAAIACNKTNGIRAAVCHDTYIAHQCVEHDNVQVIAIGGQVIGEFLAKDIIETFLRAEFSESAEFRRRVKKLEEMDNKRRK